MTALAIMCFALVVTALLLQDREIKSLTKNVESLTESRNKYVTKYAIDLMELSIDQMKRDIMHYVESEVKDFSCDCDDNRWWDNAGGCDCDISGLENDIHRLDRAVRYLQYDVNTMQSGKT